jgi:hypothetical protein
MSNPTKTRKTHESKIRKVYAAFYKHSVFYILLYFILFNRDQKQLLHAINASQTSVKTKSEKISVIRGIHGPFYLG